MPSKDRHGKTAQDYGSALIAEFDAVPGYYRRRKARRYPLLLTWLLVPVALLWLNWPSVQRWLHPAPVAETSVEVSESQNLVPPPVPAVAAPRQAIFAPQPLDTCLKQGNVVDEEVLRCRYGAVPRAQESASAPQGMVSAAYLAQYKAGRELAPVRTFSSPSFTESQVVPKWDGGGSYLATWEVHENRIDYSSDCGNHRKGSIEYRGCRKRGRHSGSKIFGIEKTLKAGTGKRDTTRQQKDSKHRLKSSIRLAPRLVINERPHQKSNP